MSGWSRSFIWVETVSAAASAELVEKLGHVHPGPHFESDSWGLSVGELGPRLLFVESVQRRGFSNWLVESVKSEGAENRLFWSSPGEELVGQTHAPEEFGLLWDFAACLGGDAVDFEETMRAFGGSVQQKEGKRIALLSEPIDFGSATTLYDARGGRAESGDLNVQIMECLLVENDERLRQRPLKLALGVRCVHGWIGTAILTLFPMTPEFEGGGAIVDVTGELNVPAQLFSAGMWPSPTRKRRSPPPWARFESLLPAGLTS